MQSAPIFFVAVALVGCGSSASPVPAPTDGGLADGTTVVPIDAGAYADADSGSDTHPVPVDGGYVAPDGGVLPASRFITTVVSFTPGTCAGFGASRMPDVVYGPPVGAGTTEGGLDVVSLGNGGEIVVAFEPNAIVDGPGVDVLVFENAFFIGGNSANVFAELGEVSVSDDGLTWSTFPCTAAAATPPYGMCAGWHPVLSNPSNGIDPFDPTVAGGDPFDLADVGLARARFLRVRDKSNETCPVSPPQPTSDGFDLDAVAIVHAQTP